MPGILYRRRYELQRRYRDRQFNAACGRSHFLLGSSSSGRVQTRRRQHYLPRHCRSKLSVPLPRGGGIMPLQKKFPISETFDAPSELSNTDECFCRAHITVSDITAEIAQDNFGENRIIELDFNFSAEVFCTCNRRTSLTRDIYSTDYKSDASYRTVEMCRPCRMITSNFSVNAEKSLRFPRFFAAHRFRR